MRLRIAASTLAGALLAGCGGTGASGGGMPVPSPVATPSPQPSATPTPSGGAGGVVNIPVPTPAPVLCAPSAVRVAVNQNVIVNCDAAGYAGGFTFAVADSTVASVAQPVGSRTFFVVTGLRPGTTTLTIRYASTGSGSVSIAVQ